MGGIYMPLINVKMLEGRTIEQKRELVEVFTREATRILDCKPDQVTMIIDEYSREGWAKNGKLLADQ